MKLFEDRSYVVMVRSFRDYAGNSILDCLQAFYSIWKSRVDDGRLPRCRFFGFDTTRRWDEWGGFPLPSS